MKMLDRTLPTDSVIDLDHPCKFCKVLDLDDGQLGGVAKTAEGRASFVDFGEFLETEQDRIITSGTFGRGWVSATPDFDPEAPRTVTKTELGLDYSRRDELPELPGLSATAIAGCSFCKVLRNDLMDAWEWIEQNWDNEYENGIDFRDEGTEVEAKAKAEAKISEEADDEDDGEDAEEVKFEGEEDDHDDEEEKKKKEKEVENEATDAKFVHNESVNQKTDQLDVSDIFEDSDGSSVFTNADGEEGIGEHKAQGDDRQEENQEKATESAKATEKQPSRAELVISEITYKLRNYEHDSDRLQRTWSDAVFVFFTIRFKEKTRRYSMSYNLYAEPTGMNSILQFGVPSKLILCQTLVPHGCRSTGDLIRAMHCPQHL